MRFTKLLLMKKKVDGQLKNPHHTCIFFCNDRYFTSFERHLFSKLGLK